MKRNPYFIKDFFSVFAPYIVLIIYFSLLSGNGRKDTGYQGFNGSAYQSVSLHSGGTNFLKNEPSLIERKFFWKDSKSRGILTKLIIKKKDLKNEIKKFGLFKGMKNQLMIQKRGFKIIGRRNQFINGRLTERINYIIDYKKIFNRNIKYFGKLSSQLISSIAFKDFNPLYDVLKFVQHIPYRSTPFYYSGKFINKFYTPLVTIYEKGGDCDSKSLLLSEFLLASIKKPKMGIVLVNGQGIAHGLLALKQKPLMGMTPFYVRGYGYHILLETTDTRWAPGFINYRVGKAIQAGYGRFIPLNYNQ